MATITPLLDTLLHEVLGRRMDAPARGPLNPPVAPVYPGKAPQAVQGDPRLQSRGGAVNVQDALATGKGQQHKLPHSTTRSPASAYTSLSSAAHLISRVLDRFPAPPSIIRNEAPLLQSSAPLVSGSDENRQQGRQLLQEALRSSISNSGLFYESHLKAWFRGRLPLEALRREPQMQGAVLARASQSPASASATPPAAEEAPRTAEGRSESLPVAVPVTEPPENLQSLLRHQLELLVSPVLRWEGEVWPGFFMSLILHLREELEDTVPEDDQSEEDAGQCRAELQLRLDGFGLLDAKLNLRGSKLNLMLQTDSSALLTLMQSRHEQLRDALTASGFEPDLEMTLAEVADDSQS